MKAVITDAARGRLWRIRDVDGTGKDFFLLLPLFIKTTGFIVIGKSPEAIQVMPAGAGKLRARVEYVRHLQCILLHFQPGDYWLRSNHEGDTINICYGVY